jgi:hypothetical protein
MAIFLKMFKQPTLLFFLLLPFLLYGQSPATIDSLLSTLRSRHSPSIVENGFTGCLLTSERYYNSYTGNDSTHTDKNTIKRYPNGITVWRSFRYDLPSAQYVLTGTDSTIKDSKGRLIYQERRYWNGNILTFSIRYRAFFTGDRMETDSFTVWEDKNGTGTFVPERRYIAEFDVSNSLQRSTFFIWLEATNSWRFNQRSTYFYDIKGRRIKTEKELWNSLAGSLWPNGQTIFEYPADTITISTGYQANGNPSSRDIISFNSMGKVLSESSFRFQGDWQPFYVSRNYYDANHRQIANTFDFYGPFMSRDSTSFLYDQNDCIYLDIRYNWDISSQQWLIQYKRYTFYSEPSSVSSASTLSVEVYPNPVYDGRLTISSEDGGLLSLYDVQGALIVNKWVQAGQTLLELPQDKQGFYILMLQNHKGVATQKVFLE